MSQRLTPITVATPGRLGLQKQEAGPLLDIRYADLVRNCVIDDAGRPAARQGWIPITLSPLAGEPDVEQIFEYIDEENNRETISAADDKLFSGTTTLTNISGSLTITANEWQFANINGDVVGFQKDHEPIIYKGSGTFTLLQQEITSWQPNTSYTENDVVRASSGNETLFFVADSTGTSFGGSPLTSGSPQLTGSPLEPDWNTTPGGTTDDGSLTWTTRRFPNGDAVLAAHGRIWVFDSTHTVVYYSDDLLPHKFEGGNAGFIDLKSVWSHGMDVGVALAEFNKRLVIFAEDSVTIYANADVVADLTLEDIILDVGCIVRDSVQNTGKDLLYLDNDGVRSLGRTVIQDVLPLSEKTSHIRDFIRTLYTLSDADERRRIRSVFDDVRGQYLLSFPAEDTVLWLDLRIPINETQLRATTWQTITPTAMEVNRDGELLLGKPGVIAKYDGYTDNGDSYKMSFRTAWSDWGNDITKSYRIANSIKILKRMRVVFVGGSGYDVKFVWFFDYSNVVNTNTVSIAPAGEVAEWGISEFGEAEWGGGAAVILTEAITSLIGAGKIVKLGFDIDINGTPVSVQQFNILTKIGRYKA